MGSFLATKQFHNVVTHELKNVSTSEPGVYKFLKYHSFSLFVNQIL